MRESFFSPAGTSKVRRHRPADCQAVGPQFSGKVTRMLSFSHLELF